MREGKGSEGSLSVRVGTGLLGIPRVDAFEYLVSSWRKV